MGSQHPKSRPQISTSKKLFWKWQAPKQFPVNYVVPRFPWLCSLKGPGFTGRHRCGVTLLSGSIICFCFCLSCPLPEYLFSGPASPDVILVSAAHCNFVCKESSLKPKSNNQQIYLRTSQTWTGLRCVVAGSPIYRNPVVMWVPILNMKCKPTWPI